MYRFRRSLVYFVLACFLLSHDFSSGLHSAVHWLAGNAHSLEQNFSSDHTTNLGKHDSSGSIPSCLLAKLIKAASGDFFKAQDDSFARPNLTEQLLLQPQLQIVSTNDGFSHLSRGPPALL